MGGTILVSKTKGLATGTAEFDYLADKIRLAFLPGEESLVATIYEPLDEGGMTFIAADELDACTFMAFARAVKNAYAVDAQDPAFHRHRDAWIELLDIIEQDPRSSMSSAARDSQGA